MNDKGRRRSRGGRKPRQSPAAQHAMVSPPKTAAPETTTQAWLDAIQEATDIVTPGDRRPQDRSSNNDDEEIEASLTYVARLASLLEQHMEDWDQPPTDMPPPFRASPVRGHDEHAGEHPVTTYTVPLYASGNRFAGFQYDDDDDDEEEEGDDLDEPVPVTPPPILNNLARGIHLAMRRLMIRIVTAQSELYAFQASYAPPHWTRGAQLYQSSLIKIHQALSLADSECARWLEKGEIPTPLQDDATVVEVAIHYLTNELNRFRAKAVQRERALMQKLEPQWQSRDEIRERWGEERWTANPRPKQNYKKMREDDEKQLKEIRTALAQLNAMDTESALEASRTLKDQLRSSSSHKKQRQRDNGERPYDLSKRVPLGEYPDPTEYGWKFTGSWNNTVEFFETEDGGVKLDWYFTTGTVKTSLDHPTQGKTQLFGARVTHDTYIKILQNPRAHTNVRYQERKPTKQLWEPESY